MAMKIKDTRAIVTGGANGIGFQYSRQLLLNGAKTVVILDLDVKSGVESMKKLNDEFGDGRAHFIATDVSKLDEFETSFNKAVKDLGGLEILINNAGILNDAKWIQEIDINLKALIKGTLLAIETMGKHKGGRGGTVINVSSTAGLGALKHVPVYCATKYAVLGFTKTISKSFDETGVAIKTICPGAADTILFTDKSPRYLPHIDPKEAYDRIKTLPCQTPEAVAIDVMRLIEEAPAGAIWLSELGTPTSSVNIPHYLTWTEPI